MHEQAFLSAPGVIVHQTNTGVPVCYKVGARFETIDADTRSEIADFLSKPPLP